MSILKGVKLFATGKWNGELFTKEHIASMVAAFKELKMVHAVPLKFGHNGKQEMTDGQPALGWVSAVYASSDGETLLGDFEDVPEIVMAAFKARRYRKLSIEMAQGVNYKGKDYLAILSGVALLGADIPAVNTLGDLEQYIPKEAFASDSLAVFTIDEPNYKPTKQKEGIMPTELEALTKRLDDMAAKFETQATSNATLRKENDELKTKFSTLEAETKKKDAETKTAKVSVARAGVTEFFDAAVKKEVITPAQRTAFFKVLRVEDDDAVLTIEKDDMMALLPEGAKAMFTKQTGKSGGNETDLAPDVELSAKVSELMGTNPNLNHFTATNLAMQANPKLAERYRDMNGEVA